MNELRTWFVVCAVAIVVLTAAGIYLGGAAPTVTVPEGNSSMRPAIGDNQTTFSIDTSWHSSKTRDDIVVFYPPGRSQLSVARVVALPGDRLEIARGKIRFNGKSPSESKKKVEKTPDVPASVVPAGCAYLLVDGTKGEDSAEFGPLPLWRILGKIK